nr:GGDEF domain-containing protein [Sphingomicrobium aestuariivivum]
MRLPFFPSLLDAGSAYPEFGAEWLPGVLLVSSAFAVPAVVLLTIAAIVQSELRHYRRQSEHDGMTDLLNRRAFGDAVRAQSPRFGAIVLADIDHFKSINDRYGHGVGDDVIRHFATLLEQAAPCAGRFGGEEFAIALPGYSLARAAELAEQLRADFAAYRHEAFSEKTRLSASFGVASYVHRRPLGQTYAAADQALYRAKDAGRNAVAIYGTDEEERLHLHRLTA